MSIRRFHEGQRVRGSAKGQPADTEWIVKDIARAPMLFGKEGNYCAVQKADDFDVVHIFHEDNLQPVKQWQRLEGIRPSEVRFVCPTYGEQRPTIYCTHDGHWEIFKE